MTALLLTGRDFPAEIARSYRQACATLGVEPVGKGYGLVLALDGDGGRWTRVTRDVAGIEMALSLAESGIECGFDVDPADSVADLPGWPVTCTLGLLGFPEPHDPVTDRPILRPATGDAARAAAHRVRVARIAEELDFHRTRRHYEQAWLEDAHNFGDHDPGPPPVRMIDLACEPDPAHPRVAAFLAELAAPATGEEPVGVRSGKARGGFRVVQVTRPGWTLIARVPDGPHIALLDDVSTPLDVTRVDGVAGCLARLAALGTIPPS